MIDSVKLKVVKSIAVADCAPAGLAMGSGNRLVLGRNAGQRNSSLPPRITVVGSVTRATAEPGLTRRHAHLLPPVTNGKRVMVPEGPDTIGHQTLTQAALERSRLVRSATWSVEATA